MDGRRKRFQFWGPPEYDPDLKPRRKEEALRDFGPPIKRYYLHKAPNNLIQGTSAGITKQALIDCYDVGYLACLTVHDENDFPNITSMKQAREIKEIHEHVVELEVPLVCDGEVGDTWGSCEKI